MKIEKADWTKFNRLTNNFIQEDHNNIYENTDNLIYFIVQQHVTVSLPLIKGVTRLQHRGGMQTVQIASKKGKEQKSIQEKTYNIIESIRETEGCMQENI